MSWLASFRPPLRGRLLLFVALISLVLASAWLLRRLDETPPPPAFARYEPDMSMTNFSTTVMGEDGRPGHRLSASRLLHYSQDGATELIGPHMELFRPPALPVHLHAKRAWLAAHNDVALLRGKVRLLRVDASGEMRFDVRTAHARVLLSEEYADTDAEVRLLKGKAQMDSIGMQAYLRENRLEFDRHVRTTIASPAAAHP